MVVSRSCAIVGAGGRRAAPRQVLGGGQEVGGAPMLKASCVSGKSTALKMMTHWLVSVVCLIKFARKDKNGIFSINLRGLTGELEGGIISAIHRCSMSFAIGKAFCFDALILLSDRHQGNIAVK